MDRRSGFPIESKVCFALGVALLLAAFLFAVCGCSVGTGPSRQPAFQTFYDALGSLPRVGPATRPAERLFTFSVSSMPMVAFLRYVAQEAGVTIVCAEDLDKRNVSLEIKGESCESVLGLLGRRVGADVVRSGDVFYLGQLRTEDRALLIRVVRGLDKDQIAGALGVFLSETGRMQVQPDGLVILGDKASVILRVSELLDRLESVGHPCWVVQYYLISITDSAGVDVGLDTTQAASIAVTIANASSAIGMTTKVDAAFQAVLRATRDVQGVEMAASPLFLMLDGGKAMVQSGQDIPIAQRTVSDAGTVTTTGYTSIKVGLGVSAEIREMSERSIQICTLVDMSELAGYVGEAPITRANRFESRAVLEAGGVYLLGAISRHDYVEDVKGFIPGMSFKRTNTKGVVQVWCRAYRVRGSASDGGPVAGRVARQVPASGPCPTSQPSAASAASYGGRALLPETMPFVTR